MADRSEEKQLPNSVEAEEAVLGALLIDTDSWLQIAATGINPEWFYLQRNSWVFESIHALLVANKPVDQLLLIEDLEKRDRLADIGGPAYLTDLINATPTSVHISYYCNIVKAKFVQRKTIRYAAKVAQMAYDFSGDDPETLLADIQGLAMNIIDTKSSKGLQHISKPAGRVISMAEKASQNPGALPGLVTGLTDFDKLIGGLQKQSLVVIAARPGMGKTAFSINNIGYNLALKYSKKVAVFSLEMSDDQLLYRMFANAAGIDSQKITRGEATAGDFMAMMEAEQEFTESKMFIDDTAAITPMHLRSECLKMQATEGLDIVIVDYLQLMTFPGQENRQQEISRISASLKALAKELNICVVALSQLSRAVESRVDKRPVMSDLRESGAIEQDADTVAFLYRDEVYNPKTELPNIAEIGVVKNRHGSTGIVSTFFSKPFQRFSSLDRHAVIDQQIPQAEVYTYEEEEDYGF